MDKTLTLNFCPFRFPAWPPPTNLEGTIAFSKRMWAKVFEILEPAVIVCLGNEPMEHLDVVLRRGGQR